MDNSLDNEEVDLDNPGLGPEPTITEKLEEALGKLLMKFKEIETRVKELEYKTDDLEGAIDNVRSDVDDFDLGRVDNVETDLEELKDVLRNV